MAQLKITFASIGGFDICKKIGSMYAIAKGQQWIKNKLDNNFFKNGPRANGFEYLLWRLSCRKTWSLVQEKHIYFFLNFSLHPVLWIFSSKYILAKTSSVFYINLHVVLGIDAYE